MEYEVVILELDDGTEEEFAILETFEVEGSKYVLLGMVKEDVVTDDPDNMLFMKDNTDDSCKDDEILLTMIESDEEYDHIVDEYVKLFGEE